MFSLTLGATYKFTLSSGKVVTIIVHGTRAHPVMGAEWEISVDGVRGAYSDLNQALGDSFSNITLV